MDPKNLIDNVPGLMFGVGCFVVAGLAFMFPDFFADTPIEGRKILWKLAFSWLWGWPIGIVATLLGTLAIIGSFMANEDDD